MRRDSADMKKLSTSGVGGKERARGDEGEGRRADRRNICRSQSEEVVVESHLALASQSHRSLIVDGQAAVDYEKASMALE